MSNKLKYLDKKGLAKVFSLIKFGHKKIWHGTLAEWEALSAEEKAEYDQAEVIDEYTGVPVVVDKVEAGNLNPVTSNAVAGCTTPDYAHQKTISANTWTADEDVWVSYTNSYTSGSSPYPLTADGVVISTATTNSRTHSFAGRIPRGTVLSANGLNSDNFKAWPFKA